MPLYFCFFRDYKFEKSGYSIGQVTAIKNANRLKKFSMYLYTKENFKDSKTVKYQDYTALGLTETKKKVENGDFYGVLYIPKKDSLELLAKSIAFYSIDSPGMSLMNGLEARVETHLRNLKLIHFEIDLIEKKSDVSFWSLK